MPLALIKPKPRVRVPARMKAAGAPSNCAAPAGARLMDYFGIGAQVAMMPGGMALAVQADLQSLIGQLRDSEHVLRLDAYQASCLALFCPAR